MFLNAKLIQILWILCLHVGLRGCLAIMEQFQQQPQAKLARLGLKTAHIAPIIGPEYKTTTTVEIQTMIQRDHGVIQWIHNSDMAIAISQSVAIQRIHTNHSAGIVKDLWTEQC